MATPALKSLALIANNPSEKRNAAPTYPLYSKKCNYGRTQKCNADLKSVKKRQIIHLNKVNQVVKIIVPQCTASAFSDLYKNGTL